MVDPPARGTRFEFRRQTYQTEQTLKNCFINFKQTTSKRHNRLYVVFDRRRCLLKT